MIYRPEYIERIIAYMDTPFVKILTGVRRCGKSTIMNMLREEVAKRGVAPDRILHFNFDSLEYEDMTAKKLFAAIRGQLSTEGKTYLFLDEIQEITGWEKVVNSLMSDYNVDIYVTGSNSRMMSSEISTYLTGRYVSFRIYPLSFAEYLKFRNEFAVAGDPKQELVRYLQFGGFPAIHLREYTIHHVCACQDAGGRQRVHVALQPDGPGRGGGQQGRGAGLQQCPGSIIYAALLRTEVACGLLHVDLAWFFQRQRPARTDRHILAPS